jgi:hypothetical protein
LTFKYKYYGTERMFFDPNSPFNDIPSAELEKMLREQELKNNASRALNQLSPEVRNALQEQLTPKQDSLIPEPVEPDKPAFRDSYPWEVPNGGI